jgi:hypothetical protein
METLYHPRDNVSNSAFVCSKNMLGGDVFSKDILITYGMEEKSKESL